MHSDVGVLLQEAVEQGQFMPPSPPEKVNTESSAAPHSHARPSLVGWRREDIKLLASQLAGR
jgi:hypothetical protein